MADTPKAILKDGAIIGVKQQHNCMKKIDNL
jgi:hypothetical protein